jgi:hypothetical protein
MTGVAAERTLFLLRDAVEAAISNPGLRQKFVEKTKGKPTKQTFDEIWKRLDPVHDELASGLRKEDVRAELSGTFDLIRKTRTRCRSSHRPPDFTRRGAQPAPAFPTVLFGGV